MTQMPSNVSVLRPGLTAGRVEVAEVSSIPRVPLFTRGTLAEYLSLHVNTIDRLVKRGQIPAYRVAGKLRFYPEDVDVYVRGHAETI
jgi:excisionase family DNA binding protein